MSSAAGRGGDRHGTTAGLFSGCWINDRPNLRDAIGRKSTHLRMFAYGIFIRSNVYAIDFVIGDIALHPLNLRP